MADKHPLHQRHHASAKQSEEAIARLQNNDSYKLAFADNDFLLEDDLRHVRLQLEYLKPERVLDKHQIDATVVVFGSARFLSPEQAQYNLDIAQAELDKTPNDATTKAHWIKAKRDLKNSRYYSESQKFAHLVTEHSQNYPEHRVVVISGGGPGVMEAANRGATEAGGESIGLNIVLPKEQYPNPYITPEFCFQFHYFAIRKMHFLMRARALVALPGGYGTLDELFETLTLIQTKKIDPVPIVLIGKGFWSKLINFDLLIEEGLIAPDDVKLFTLVNTAEEAWAHICRCYELNEGNK
ncbi:MULTISPECIES: TIGR00730 family Rossman fold protein [unclassified Idiomarina]|uniref:LOG family protein n=1 Tax=unclassified Idiomarina TaxID=2614829 RepID=UPI000C8C0614|nr:MULTISPECIES: TIGR00730 family Rossman fold protein [unclassified Idiomarina]MAD53300.1 TIGR00730 family Rossman fold protein [Idiomarinaceae bacterium]MEC9318879.1 TIGR00730 family Rossman fold protein [Pseudomonadota bacterium]NQZ04779.1 TIGR00730 family Rossman fold protein [Idiomarina sp.]